MEYITNKNDQYLIATTLYCVLPIPPLLKLSKISADAPWDEIYAMTNIDSGSLHLYHLAAISYDEDIEQDALKNNNKDQYKDAGRPEVIPKHQIRKTPTGCRSFLLLCNRNYCGF